MPPRPVCACNLQEHYTPAATPISLVALPDGRLAFADSAGAVFLESGPGSAAFNQLVRPSTQSALLAGCIMPPLCTHHAF